MRLRHFADQLAALAFPPRPSLQVDLDRALKDRRRGREDRQATAVRREADKHHQRFVTDPIIRALRPDLITTQGEDHVR